MKILELRDTLSEWFNVCLSFSLGKGTPLIFQVELRKNQCML